MVDIETLIKSLRLSWLERMFSNNSGMQLFKFRRVCGVCSGELSNWLGRTIAFYQVFSSRGGWLWANGVSVPRKVTPGLPGWNFFAVEVIVFFPYTLTKGVRVEKDKIK